MHALRQRVDAVQKRREDLLAAGEAGDAVIEINRAQVKASQVKLGTNPGLKPVLQNLEAMERAMPTVEIALKAARPKPPAPIQDPFAAHAAAPPDLSKLPRHKVLRIADGDIIEVQKIPGVMSVRLLGVAAPTIDSPLLRSKVLGDLINGQVVALSYDPRGPLDKGRIVAQVYRVSDGLFVNLKLVQEGYGVTAANAPEPLQTELLTAEREAHAGQRGLWSPAAKAEAAALEKEKTRLHQDLVKGLTHPRGKKVEEKGALRNWLEVVDAAEEPAAMRWIDIWRRRYTPRDPGTIRKNALEAARLAEEKRRRDEEERRRAPEIDAGPAAGAVALMVAGMLMLVDRRRTRLA